MFCVVCNELCAESTPTCERGHTTCDECLCGLVRATLSADNVRTARGLVNCPWRGVLGRGTAEVCTAAPWTLEQLAPRLDSATTGAVAGAAIAAVAVAHDETTRLRAELANAGATGGGGGVGVPDEGRAERLQRWRQRFIESILTLKCPRCTTAFTEYDGCDSLTCSNQNCGAFFCALCLEPFANSGECHTHVSQARHHNDGFVGLHGGQERFRRFHAIRRRKLIDTRIAGIPEDEIFRNELRILLLHDAELEENDGDHRDGGGGGGGGGGDGGDYNDNGGNLGLFDLMALILGDRAQQRHPFVKGVQALIDLAPLAAGAYAAFTGNGGGGGGPAAAPAAQARRGASTSSVFVAAGAGAVIAGSIAAALSVYSALDKGDDVAALGGGGAAAAAAAAAGGGGGGGGGGGIGGGGGGGTLADHPDAVALSLALGRPLSLDELQLSPEELREMRRAMLD
jgi:hypothetical protein